MSRNQYFTEEDCLRIIDSGEDTAYGLLVDNLPRIDRKFDRVDKAIRDLLAEVRQVFPDAQYYTASGGFHLLLGCPHSATSGLAQHQLTAVSGRASIGDGDY